jgi:hypothetical protein
MKKCGGKGREGIRQGSVRLGLVCSEIGKVKNVMCYISN